MLRRVLACRARRLQWLTGLHAAVAWLGALLLPVPLFVLGPVLFGAAHVVADLRHLLIRQCLPTGYKRLAWGMCGVLLAVRIWDTWRADVARLEVASVLVWAFASIAWASVRPGAACHATRLRSLIAMGIWGCMGAVSWRWPHGARLVFVHVHNIVALLAWGFLARRAPQMPPVKAGEDSIVRHLRASCWAWPALGVVVAATVLMSGVLYRVTLGWGGAQAFGLHVMHIADWIAPHLRGDIAVGVVCGYVFLQSVHYMMWLCIIPQQQAQRSATLSFRMSARSLRRDLGTTGVVVALSVVLFVLFAGTINLHATRSLFLSLAMFHGYLELSVLTYGWVAAAAA